MFGIEKILCKYNTQKDNVVNFFYIAINSANRLKTGFFANFFTDEKNFRIRALHALFRAFNRSTRYSTGYRPI